LRERLCPAPGETVGLALGEPVGLALGECFCPALGQRIDAALRQGLNTSLGKGLRAARLRERLGVHAPRWERLRGLLGPQLRAGGLRRLGVAPGKRLGPELGERLAAVLRQRLGRPAGERLCPPVRQLKPAGKLPAVIRGGALGALEQTAAGGPQRGSSERGRVPPRQVTGLFRWLTPGRLLHVRAFVSHADVS
jgi:hypothetical protein